MSPSLSELEARRDRLREELGRLLYQETRRRTQVFCLLRQG